MRKKSRQKSISNPSRAAKQERFFVEAKNKQTSKHFMGLGFKFSHETDDMNASHFVYELSQESLASLLAKKEELGLAFVVWRQGDNGLIYRQKNTALPKTSIVSRRPKNKYRSTSLKRRVRA